MSENKTAILVIGGIILMIALFSSISIDFDSSKFFEGLIIGVLLVLGFALVGLLAVGWEKITGRPFKGNNIWYFIIAFNVIFWSLFFIILN
jgi:hypothetical protein